MGISTGHALRVPCPYLSLAKNHMNAFAQAAKTRKRTHSSKAIDPELLKITNDPPPGKRVMGEPKYDAIFKALKPGQPIAQALRKFLKDRELTSKFDVRSVQHYPKDQRGGVWMIARPAPAAKA